MKTRIGIICGIVILIFITSCQTIKVTNKDLGGNWNIVFSGDLTGSGSFYISGSDNSFSSGNITLTNVEAGTYADYRISGSINTNIITSGYFKRNNSTVGTIDGTFAIDAGAGTYVVNDTLEGGWTASKR